VTDAAPARPSVDRELAQLLIGEFPEDAAPLIETADAAETARLLAGEPAEWAIPLLRRLTPDRGARVLAALPEQDLRGVMPLLDQARTAAMLARMDEAERERCLDPLDEALRAELRALMEYPPETAGSLMDPRVTSFRPDTTVAEVVDRLRRFRNRRIQDVFLVDADGRLVGAVPLQDVVLAQPGDRLEGLAADASVSVQAVSSRDEVIETFETHRVATLPVVDFDGRLLGVLRQRELIQAAQENAAADAVTMVGASAQERALSSPVFAMRKRLPWLQINLLTAFLAASVVGLFESTIARVTALAVLLPVVAGQSGNTGAQALAVTMRGLALREVRVRHWLQVSAKELLAGAGNGVAVALTTSLAVWAWSRSTGLAAVIGISMVISMTLAGLSGAAIPMILTALRQDPAQSSSIILTTVTDVVGFFSFLGIATVLASWI
jgi:magnesium transporter